MAVIGPNNFPLAFNGISGGDFAAAVAAGNPVIVKGHANHPRTTRLLAEAAFEDLHASEASPVPKALVQLVYHIEPRTGLKLAAHPAVAATAFTFFWLMVRIRGPAGLGNAAIPLLDNGFPGNAIGHLLEHV